MFDGLIVFVTRINQAIKQSNHLTIKIKMLTLFYIVFTLLILAELTKGLSANGTPPVLQKYPWQLDLAHFMWSNILYFRILLVAILAFLVWSMSPAERSGVLIPSIILGAIWGFIYWVFNLFWVGKYKFDPLKNPTFKTSGDNKIPLTQQVMGVNWKGVQKAYPVSMIFYHHQVPDTIGNHPVWATYCGLCRSGRVYDRMIDGQTLDFGLVGAITFNAVFKDLQTGSWWRQETGEAVKGPQSGKLLEDVPMEQMSLENWLAKHPDSLVLQYDPTYQKKYDFLTSLMNYEISFPGWMRQETPRLIVGVAIDGESKAYDWETLQKRRMVMDTVGGNPLMVLSSTDGTSPFVYERTVDGETLNFEIDGDTLTDINTQSTWDMFGRCTAGKLQGKELSSVQNYQQFIRAWASFHPESTYYQF